MKRQYIFTRSFVAIAAMTPVLGAMASQPPASAVNSNTSAFDAVPSVGHRASTPSMLADASDSSSPSTSYGATSSDSNRYSWIPYTTSGYFGISGNRAKLNTDCIVGENCNDPKTGVSVYTGGMFSPYFGLELGYFHLGDADRNGGTTKVQGADLELTGLLPLGNNFSLLGRAGGVYGWTDTSADPSVAIDTGKAKGFGWTAGAGLSWDFNRSWSLVAGWDRYRLKYAGDVKRNTDVTSLGLRYRF